MTTFNDDNRRIAKALNNCIAAIYALQDAGCTATRVEVGQRNPQIWIEPPGEVLQGSVHSRASCQGYCVTTFVTRIHDCEVKWEMTRPQLHAAGLL